MFKNLLPEATEAKGQGEGFVDDLEAPNWLPVSGFTFPPPQNAQTIGASVERDSIVTGAETLTLELNMLAVRTSSKQVLAVITL
ncbi:hypothetical protein E2C01_035785 [Portunus trituberculatus]|uniref:Uncharacterized protein n=1 Tax=Portunus trituberculatus TaxID=210409 RepID=A0A5B7F582_PORTR|nr:hypothetical protein [Portunus trituberculatus]